MTHMNDGRLIAYLDGALAAEDRAVVARHLEACPACTVELRSLAAVSSQFSEAVGLLDVMPPLEEAAAAVARRRSTERAAPSLRPLLRAAILVLGFAGVGSAAIPGSPVRGWALAAWHGAGALLGGDRGTPDEAVAPAVAAVEPVPAGISILPENGAARIVIKGTAPTARIRVRLVDGARVSVEARGEAADARFLTAPGRIEVLGGGPGELLVEVPRSVRSAIIEVDGRVFVAKEGDSLRTRIPAESTGAEVLFPNLIPER